MRKNAAREREQANRISPEGSIDVVIANPSTPPSPPKLLETVIKALPQESPAAQLLTRGSKRKSVREQPLQEEESGKSKTEPGTVTSEHENTKPPSSPDLLSAINQFLNLTDSEKALIVSGDQQGGELRMSQDSDDNDVQFDEKDDVMDTRL